MASRPRRHFKKRKRCCRPKRKWMRQSQIAEAFAAIRYVRKREAWLQDLRTGAVAARLVADELDKAAERLTRAKA